MKLPDFATRLGWPDSEVLPRLRELELTRPCSRCHGTGQYTLSEVENQCWKCRGKGDELPMLTRELAGEVAVRLVRGELDRYVARRRRRREAAREIQRLLGECTQAYERAAEREPVRAAELFFESEAGLSVRAVERMIENRQIDPETAAVVLSSLHRQLAEAA